MRPTSFLLILLCSTIASSSTSDPALDEASPETRTETKLPGLFNYAHYLSHFGKHYKSDLETTTRQVYFLANAFQVYVAALAYRSRLASSYLALNHLSDLSPREWKLMQSQPTSDQREQSEHSGSNSGTSPEEVAREVEAQVDGKPRRKRSTCSSRADQKPRHISMDMLIQPGEPIPERPEVLARVDPHPSSNNPDHDALALVHFSRGLAEQQERVTWLEVKVKRTKEEQRKLSRSSVKRVLNALTNYFKLHKGKQAALSSTSGEGVSKGDENCIGQDGKETAEIIREPDEMFIDLRDFDCMFRPRDQRQCGSCYAFAAVTLAEWIYCRKGGKLIRFSEQYMVDCGKKYVEGLDGCAQGQIGKLPKFIHNFGLELARHYPYLGMEFPCPYEPDTDLNKAGFIRMNLNQSVVVPVELWPEVLRRSPILVVVRVTDQFQQWAGGIDHDKTCEGGENHAMVLVGHGREAGQEFWLFRNSYGTQWGQEGYYKLAKSATKSCVLDQRGYVFGSSNGLNSLAEVKLNSLNDKVRREMAKARLDGRPFEIADKAQGERLMWFISNTGTR